MSLFLTTDLFWCSQDSMFGGFLSWISIQSSLQYLEEDKYHKYQYVWLFSRWSFQTLRAAPAGEHYVQDGLSWRSYLNHDFIPSRRLLSDQKMQKAPVKWGSVRVYLSVQHLWAHRLLKLWCSCSILECNSNLLSWVNDPKSETAV